METYRCEFCGWPCFQKHRYYLAVPQPMGYVSKLACAACYFELQIDVTEDGVPIASDGEEFKHWSE